MAETKNLCAQIPLELHTRVIEEKDQLGVTLGEYVTQIIKEHFEGGKTMTAATKTIAFQIPEELNTKLKAYLKEHNLSQRAFFLRCIEEALAESVNLAEI